MIFKDNITGYETEVTVLDSSIDIYQKSPTGRLDLVEIEDTEIAAHLIEVLQKFICSQSCEGENS